MFAFPPGISYLRSLYHEQKRFMISIFEFHVSDKFTVYTNSMRYSYINRNGILFIVFQAFQKSQKPQPN